MVDWPLFPGYVFARFGLDATAQVLGTPGVATVVRQDGAPAAIPDAEIENVRRLASVFSETGALPEPTPMVRRGQHAQQEVLHDQRASSPLEPPVLATMGDWDASARTKNTRSQMSSSVIARCFPSSVMVMPMCSGIGVPLMPA